MADRIFPSAEQDSLGSTKQINTIDWEKFAASLNKRVAAEDDEKKYKNLGSLDRVLETKYANQHVKRYMKQAEDLIDQVCRGEFGHY